MKIEISTEFETSHTANYTTKITAKIVDDKGIVLCEGQDQDAWPNAEERRATARAATKAALDRFEFLIRNARDVAKKSGLI